MALDEQENELYISLHEIMGIPPNQDEGIYRLDRKGNSTLFLEGIYNVSWSKALNALVVNNEDYNEASISYVYYTDNDQPVEFPAREIYPSPDGQWIVTSDYVARNLFLSNGEFVKKIADENQATIIWLETSKGFYYKDGDAWYLCMQDSGWQSVEIADHVSSPPMLVYP
jgi:hypothetical protein